MVWYQALFQKETTVKPCNANIDRTLRLVKHMLELADRGDAQREDVGCGIMYGILRDSAYKIQRIAQQEKQAHIEKGWWNISNHKEQGG